MAQVKVYNNTGAEAGTLELPKELFSVEMNQSLVHEAVVIQRENSRILRGVTKDRSQVQGGGRKPWKQKGTGRARHGSRRSPIWTGGGVTFGPTLLRRFGKKINKKAKRKAMAMVLSDKVASEKFIVVDSFELKDGKTKEVAALRKVLPGEGRKTLFITTSAEKSFRKALANLPKAGVIGAKSLNIVDLLKYQYIIASKAAVKAIKETYLA